MLKRTGRIRRRLLSGRSAGVGLIDVVIAVTVLALVTASVPPVLVLIAKSQFSWSEQRIAENLTRNQIEYIKATDYISGNVTYPDLPQYGEVPVPNETYEIVVVAVPVNPDTDQPLPAGTDDGMQEITVSIYHADRIVLQTRNYKVDRLDLFVV